MRITLDSTGIGGHLAIQPRHAGHAVHPVVGAGYHAPVGVRHRGPVSVLVVGIAYHIPVHVFNGKEIPAFIVLIRYASFGPGDLRDFADVVIAASLIGIIE